MKKIIALFLVVGMTTATFASCRNNGNNSTSDSTPSQSQTTSSQTSGSNSETSASTTEKPPIIFVDPQIIDSNKYDYIIRTVKDQDSNKIIGVAIFNWKQEKASANLVFDSEYVLDGVTYPVTQIGVGQGILSFQDKLESITVPSSVISIEKKAFSFCTSLKTITLSEGLEEIGEMAFWACKSLESISIPSTVTEIGKNAFSGCENLKSIKIPRRFENQINTIFMGHHEDLQIEYID